MVNSARRGRHSRHTGTYTPATTCTLMGPSVVPEITVVIRWPAIRCFGASRQTAEHDGRTATYLSVTVGHSAASNKLLFVETLHSPYLWYF